MISRIVYPASFSNTLPPFPYAFFVSVGMPQPISMTPTAASSCQQTLESARTVSPRALSFQQQEEEGDKGEGDKEGEVLCCG